MPVEKLDFKAVWEKGKTYGDWLQASEKNLREDMEQFFEKVEVPPAVLATLAGLANDVHVLAISEDWCGDVRRNIPVVAQLCAGSTKLHLRVVDKEAHPGLMVRYLTNAAEAIPIFVFFNKDWVEVGFWGPRPAECKRLMARGKGSGQMDEARAAIKAYYDKDNNQTSISEMMELIAAAAGAGVNA